MSNGASDSTGADEGSTSTVFEGGSDRGSDTDGDCDVASDGDSVRRSVGATDDGDDKGAKDSDDDGDSDSVEVGADVDVDVDVDIDGAGDGCDVIILYTPVDG